MAVHVIDQAGQAVLASDPRDLDELVASGDFLWVDMEAPEPGELALLRSPLGFHPLAVEDSETFGQRPKAEEYETFLFLVLYGASRDGRLPVEMHCFFGERVLVTVHEAAAHVVDVAKQRRARRHGRLGTPVQPLYDVVDALTDSVVPALEELDKRIDDLETDVFTDPREAELEELFVLKRRLAAFRRFVDPQANVLERIVADTMALPGLTAESERHFRDVHDHLLHLSQTIEAQREALANTVELYLSTTSQRMNAAMKRLAVVATIFLPMTFVTGYFGQNFDYLTNHVGGLAAFAVLGIAAPCVVVVGLLALFRRNRWF